MSNEAIVSLRTTLATNVRDWSADKADAWIYGIVCGWGDALPEVAARHGWGDEAVARLVALHGITSRDMLTPDEMDAEEDRVVQDGVRAVAAALGCREPETADEIRDVLTTAAQAIERDRFCLDATRKTIAEVRAMVGARHDEATTDAVARALRREGSEG